MELSALPEKLRVCIDERTPDWLRAQDGRELPQALKDIEPAILYFYKLCGMGPIDDVLIPLTQISDAGRVSACELSQVTERMPPLLKCLSELRGITPSDYRSSCAEGGVSSSNFFSDIDESYRQILHKAAQPIVFVENHKGSAS